MTNEIKTSWTWRYITLTVVISFLTGLSGYLLKYWFEPDESPDYFLLNRPYLEPRLILSGNATKTFYSFSIRNNGKLPTHDLSFAFVFPKMSGSEGPLLTARELAPGGEMSFEIPDTAATAEAPTGRTTLYAIYSTQVKGKTRHFRDRFDFAQRRGSDQPTTLLYELANREEAPTTTDDMLNITGISQGLDTAVGTFTFWFETQTNEVDIPRVLFNSKTKALVYHPRAKMLTLNNQLVGQTNLVWATELPPDTRRWHFVRITWSNEEMSLFIDGDGPGRLPTETCVQPIPPQ